MKWRDDPRFASNSARMSNLAALMSQVDAVHWTRTKSEWIALFAAAGMTTALE